MAKEIFDTAVEFFQKVIQSPETGKFLAGHDETFLFEIKDGSPFYVEVENGNLSVKRGRPEKENMLLEVTPIDTDQKTLRNIFEGKIRPVKAIESRNFSIVAGTYEGGLITLLMRIGYDIAREEAISKYKWE